MGTAKKAGLVKTTVEDGLKGEQRIGVTLTLKNGKAYRYDEYINVK